MGRSGNAASIRQRRVTIKGKRVLAWTGSGGDTHLHLGVWQLNAAKELNKMSPRNKEAYTVPGSTNYMAINPQDFMHTKFRKNSNGTVRTVTGN